MQFLPDMCLGPKDRPLHFGDDPDSESGLLSRSLGEGLHFLTVLGVVAHVFWKLYNNFISNYIAIFCGYNSWDIVKEI